jgi:iron complex outermembrane receptor protein
VFWASAPLTPTWGATLLAGIHGQEQIDVNADDWADLPHYARAIVRPRLFWDDRAGRSFFATLGATWENRSGGTTTGAVLAPLGLPYVEALETRHLDAAAAAQAIVGGAYVVTARGSFAHAHQDHRYGEVRERDTRETAFGEIAVRRALGVHTWVAGAAFERDAFRPRDLPRFAFTHGVPGVFAQDDVDVTKWLVVSASARLDVHNEFGRFFSPRISALVKADGWSSRVSFGTGFFAPTPLTEETEAAGLSRLAIPDRLKAERGRGLSVDLTRSAGPLSATVTLFSSRVRDPISVDRDTAFAMRNLSAPVTNTGGELLGTWRRAPFSATATYSYVRAFERTSDAELRLPLTPRHSAGVVGMWEPEGKGRVGIEWYYTGAQRLEANPYRDESRPYMIVGALVERRIGRYRLFVNGENLANVQQTDWDPLVRPTRGVDGRWTVDSWAPLDGRNINGGVRITF